MGVQTETSIHGATVLTAWLGSEEDGLTTFWSHQDGGHLAVDDVEAFYDHNYIEVRLFLAAATTTFKNLLKRVTRSRQDEDFAAVVACCNFSLCVMVDDAHQIRKLALKVYWLHEMLSQSEQLPFQEA